MRAHDPTARLNINGKPKILNILTPKSDFCNYFGVESSGGRATDIPAFVAVQYNGMFAQGQRCRHVQWYIEVKRIGTIARGAPEVLSKREDMSLHSDMVR